MSPAGIPEPSERVAAESPVAGIVLTGGRSRRMGRDKCAIVLDGRTLLQRVVDALDGAVDELLVVGSPGRPPLEVHSTRPLRALADPEPHGGPLVGIATGLAATTAPVAVIVACDLPYLAPPLLRLLAARAGAGARLVVPLRGGEPQLLCAAWRREALDTVRDHLEAGDRAVAGVLDDLDAELLPPEAYAAADPDGRSFVNLNTPEQLAAERSAR